MKKKTNEIIKNNAKNFLEIEIVSSCLDATKVDNKKDKKIKKNKKKVFG